MRTLHQITQNELSSAHPLPTKPFDRLQVGQIVTFKKKPAGSWLSEGEAYVVEWKDKTCAYFRNVKRGSGTFDKDWQINLSETA